MREFGIKPLSHSEVSQVTTMFKKDLAYPPIALQDQVTCRRHPLRQDALQRRDAIVLTVIGICRNERWRVLGISVALSEAEIHWRDFLKTLVGCGMQGGEPVVSDNHVGFRTARRALIGAAAGQRRQFHLGRSALHHASSAKVRKRTGQQRRSVWYADTLAKTEVASTELIDSFRKSAPERATRFEGNVPEVLAVLWSSPSSWNSGRLE